METGIYTALTGLHAFSDGLDNISSNVSNMNTPGFKRKELLFRDSYYRDMTGNGELCLGVAIGGTQTDGSQGELQSSTNATDMAIDGQGYFVLRQNGRYLVTRGGQFSFNDDHVLADSASGALVMGWSAPGGLRPIDISEQRANRFEATTSIELAGTLSVDSSRLELSDVTVYDSGGNARTLSVVCTKGATDYAWNVEVQNEVGATIASGEFRFDETSGRPLAGYNSVSVSYTYTNGGTLALSMTSGQPDSVAGVLAQHNGTSGNTVKVSDVDGHANGSLSDVKVDTDGTIVLSYTNGQEQRLTQVAIGMVTNPSALRPLDGGLFECAAAGLETGAPGDGGRGNVIGGKVELSNVDLTSEFTDMIVIQRGYQAASQVITAANEMLQQLVEMTKTK